MRTPLRFVLLCGLCGWFLQHLAGVRPHGENRYESFAGPDDAPEINQFLLQPFLNYSFHDGLYLTTVPIIPANWKASGDKWTVPIGGGVGKIFRLGKLPVNTQVQALYEVDDRWAVLGSVGWQKWSTFGQVEVGIADTNKMSDRLAAAKSFTVRARNIVPMVGPNGQWISLIGSARVALQRPDKLLVERGGDQVPMDVYYDGKTITLYAPAENLYAEIQAPSTIDAALNEALHSAESTFPYLEVLVSDPYRAMTTDLSGALHVGGSTIEGVKTEHLALASPGVDWEIWIGAEDKLPRLVQAKYVQVEKVPTIMTHFYDWKLNSQIPAATFVFEKAPGAQKIEYVRLPEAVPVKPATGQ